MVRPTRTSSRTSHALQISVLATAIATTMGGAHAQVSVQARSASIRGRAPVVTVVVVNESASAQPPAAGQVLRADATVVDPDGDAITSTTYRWRRGATEVGTGPTYTTDAADAGQTLTLDVTASTDPASTDPDTGSATTTVNVATNTAPTVNNFRITGYTGNPRIGDVLEGHYDYNDVDRDAEDPSGIVYQWYVSSAPDGGGPVKVEGPAGTGKTFTVRLQDQGTNRTIWFNVERVRSITGTPNERTGAWGTSYVGPVLGTAPTMTEPTVTGTVAVGSELTGHPQGYNDADGDAPGTHTYKWYRVDNREGTINKEEISGATTNRYTPTGEDGGKFIMFEVTPVSVTGIPKTSPDHAVNIVTSTAVPATGLITDARIDGVVGDVIDWGRTLTAHFNWSGAPLYEVLYQWYASDVPDYTQNPVQVLWTKTTNQYTPREHDSGHYITVKITPYSAFNVVAGPPVVVTTPVIKEVRYRTTGTFAVPAGGTTIIKLGVGDLERPNVNAPTNLKVGAWRSAAGGANPLHCWLVNYTTGRRYSLADVLRDSNVFTFVDVSSEPREAGWDLEVQNPGTQDAVITQYTLEFTP
jgi:hypothetical protein